MPLQWMEGPFRQWSGKSKKGKLGAAAKASLNRPAHWSISIIRVNDQTELPYHVYGKYRSIVYTITKMIQQTSFYQHFSLLTFQTCRTTREIEFYIARL